MKRFIPLISATLVVIACSRHPYSTTNKAYKKQAKAFAKLYNEYPVTDSGGLAYATPWVGTTNFSVRRPNFVVIHHTAQNSCEQTLKTFTLERTEVSSHYVICKDGTVHHMLNDLFRGHHAGVGRWGGVNDLNSASIGIELDNNGFEPFTDPQINSLLEVLARLKRAYRVPVSNFIGHADLAPGRKVDPNRFFPWKKLAENGFGHWYDTTGITIPADFNALHALRIIGYDISKPENAIQSFKIHFVQQDTTKLINDADKKILYDLMKKYQ
jgi:N-acetylmuramoyl-L-alanine amidase